MAVPKLVYTPVRSRRSEVVHATSLHEPRKTACNKPCGGWIVALAVVGCVDCKAMLDKPVRRRNAR